jgi:hypothetical protein
MASMERRIATVAAALLVAVLPLSAASAGNAAKPIYRVDSVTVKPAAHAISIEAKGAVDSGGWVKPALRVQSVTSKTVTIIFVALPPPPTSMVIQAMLPVDAKVKVPLNSGVTIVKVAAESNSKSLKVVR